MFGGSSSTEYDEIVAKTTDENLTSENWELIMNLCDKVGDEGQEGAHAAIAAILKRLAHRNPNVQLYALSLSESLGKNLGADIHREIASRAFTQGLEKLITDRNTHEKVRKRALGLIAEWASEFENDESLGIMEDCYTGLKAKNYKFDQPQEPPPPTVDDEIRRREEEELQRVLEMSKQDLGGRTRWTEYTLASSSGAGPSGSGGNGLGRSSSATSSSPGAQSNSPPAGYSAPKYQGGYAPARTPSPDRVAAEQRQQQLEYQKQLQAQQLQQYREQQAKETHAKDKTTTVVSSSIPVISAPIDASPATDASSAPKVNIVTRVRALYTFEPTEPGELAFDKGDIIKVVDRGYKDWWRGQLKGRAGIFPVNYVVPMPEPTAPELAKEAEQEAAVFSQAVNVEKLLNMLRAFDPNQDNLADNEEIQELYRSSMALRPKIVKLIDKYSQKRADLVSMNETFLRARTIFDRLMEESLAKHTGIYDQPTFRPNSQYGPILQGRGPSVAVGGPQPFGWGPGYDQQIPLQPGPQPGYSNYSGPGGPVPTFPVGPQSQSLPSTTPVPAQHPTTVYGSIPPQGPAPQQGPVSIPQQPQPHGQAQSQGLSVTPVYGMAGGSYGGHQVSPPYSQQGPTPYPVQQQQPQSQQLYQQPQSQPAPYQQPAQAEQQQVPQLYQHSSQPVQPQTLQQPHVDAMTQPYQSQTQHQPQLVASIVSPQTQPEPLPQPEVQSQVQPHPIPHQQVEPELQPAPQPQLEVEPQLQPETQPKPTPAQPIAGPPPYPYDPSYTYVDQNVQAWASYYGQGGTDPTGSVYFISIPGVKEETPSFVVAGQQQPQQVGHDLSGERPEENAVTQSVSYTHAEGQPQIQPFVTHDQSFQARPASDGGDAPISDIGGAIGAAPGLTSMPNMPRYQLSDNPVPQASDSQPQPQTNSDGYRPGPSRGGSGDSGHAAQPSSPAKSFISTAPLNIKRAQSPTSQASSMPAWVLPKKTSTAAFGPGQTNGGSPTSRVGSPHQTVSE